MNNQIELSIIIPTLNEADTIAQALASLQPLRHQGVELIVADGGSQDDTVTIVTPMVDLLVETKPGRAVQMNAGAQRASGHVLLFLHADTRLPEDLLPLLRDFDRSLSHWGFFTVALSGRQPLLRMVERTMNWRSAITGIATGDQCLFFRRQVFLELEGFEQIPLMEDVEICKRMKKECLIPHRIPAPVITSSRRWERDGIVQTILLMFWLRFAFFIGFSPRRLVRLYYQ